MGLFDWLKKKNKTENNVTDTSQTQEPMTDLSDSANDFQTGSDSDSVNDFKTNSDSEVKNEPHFQEMPKTPEIEQPIKPTVETEKVEEKIEQEQTVNTPVMDSKPQIEKEEEPLPEEEPADVPLQPANSSTSTVPDEEPENELVSTQTTPASAPDITTKDAEIETAEKEPEEVEKKTKKPGFFSKLVSGLSKTRTSIANSLNSVFAANHIDDDFYEELEETLIMADMGVETTMNTLDELRERVKKQHIKEPADCKELLIDIIKNQMSLEENAYDFEHQKSVVMIIGVNGVGKTTSIGKLAAQFRKNGKKVIMAAADTFRAAAIEQLTEWAHRSQVDIIAQKEGADPSAVVYDALQAAKARNTDILLIDTAGRLHNKKNLMHELGKMNRIIDRDYPDAYRETLIVLDGTTGQNALEQAKQFKQVANIDGIILTKLDGTAKGGIAIAIHSELGVPVKYIGVGEGIDDLQKFDPEAYVNAIFAVDEN